MPGGANEYKPGVRLSNAARANSGALGPVSGLPASSLSVGDPSLSGMTFPRLLQAPAAKPAPASASAPSFAPAVQMAPTASRPRQTQGTAIPAPMPPTIGQAATVQGMVLPRNPQAAPVMPATSYMALASTQAPSGGGGGGTQAAPAGYGNSGAVNPLQPSPASPAAGTSAGTSGQMAPSPTAYGSVYSDAERQSAYDNLQQQAARAMQESAAVISDRYKNLGMPWLATAEIAAAQSKINSDLQDNIAKMDLEFAQAQEQSRQFQVSIDQRAKEWADMEPTRKIEYLQSLWSFYAGGAADAAEAFGLTKGEFMNVVGEAVAAGQDPQAVLDSLRKQYDTSYGQTSAQDDLQRAVDYYAATGDRSMIDEIQKKYAV